MWLITACRGLTSAGVCGTINESGVHMAGAVLPGKVCADVKAGELLD